jgi:hypothetical protein
MSLSVVISYFKNIYVEAQKFLQNKPFINIIVIPIFCGIILAKLSLIHDQSDHNFGYNDPIFIKFV